MPTRNSSTSTSDARRLCLRSPDLPPRSQDRDGHIAKRRRLLNEARFNTSEPPLPSLLALGYFLAKTNDIKAVTTILDILAISRIPTSAEQVFTSLDSKVNVEHAMSALLDLSVIFRCFLAAPLTPIAASFRTLCFRTLLERWQNVIRWLAFLLMISRSASNTDEILNVCVDSLIPIVLTPDCKGVDEEYESLMEELVYLPYTIDFVFLFFAQRDAKAARYLHLGGTHGRCRITGLFCEYLKSPETFKPMLERMVGLDRSRRQGVIRNIVERSRGVALSAVVTPIEDEMCKITIMSGMQFIRTLIFCTSSLLPQRCLYACFARCKFILVYITTLAILSKAVHEKYGELHKRGELGGFWESISALTMYMVKTVVMGQTPNPIEAFPSVWHGGAVDIALRTLCHLPPESDVAKVLIEEVLAVCVSYLTVRRVWTVAIIRRGPAIADVLFQAGETSPAAKAMCGAIWREMKRGEKTYGETGSEERIKGVNLCANRKHVSLNPNALSQETPEIKHRTCSGCRLVTYCSEECQRDDWVKFHRRECGMVSKLYREHKGLGSRTLVSLRCDQLLYLEDLANEYIHPLQSVDFVRSSAAPNEMVFITANSTEANGYLPSASGADAGNQNTSKASHALCRDETPVAVFDFVSQKGLVHKKQYPLKDYRETLQYVNQPWAYRIDGMVSDVEESNISASQDDSERRYLLVEGIFMYNAHTSVFVLAKMRRDDGMTDSRHFEVEDSVWRLGPRSAIANLWDACREDIEEDVSMAEDNVAALRACSARQQERAPVQAWEE